MKSYLQEDFIHKITNKTVFLDTNTLILFGAYEALVDDVLEQCKAVGCKVLTISSVKFEFSRTDTIQGFENRKILLRKLAEIYPIEDYIEEFVEFTVVLQKINGRMSYTDFLLYCCLYKFPDSYLLTENHKDFLTTILDREEIITIDTGHNFIRNVALYKFSKEKYEKIAESILKEK